MSKSLLLIVNGPPGVGKTTLAARLALDLKLPVINRDAIAETLFDGLDCQVHGRPALIGPASFKLLHYFARAILAAEESLIIEGFFGSPLSATEFLALQQVYDFEPLQIQCRAQGSVLLERFLSRAGTSDRHPYHRDVAFAENNRELFERGRCADLALGGEVIDIDTTDFRSFDYPSLLERVRQALPH